MSTQTPYTLKKLAEYLGAYVSGDKGCVISGLATLQTADQHQLAFYNNHRYKKYLSSTKAACVLIHHKDEHQYQGNKLVSNDPYLDYARLSKLFAFKIQRPPAIHESAVIGPNVRLGHGVLIDANVVIESDAVIGDNVHLYPGCYIGKGSVIGDNTLLYANVSVYHDIVIGKHCIVHSASVIGADGFGFAPSTKGWYKIHQLGGVIIGDDVEIGASTTIDRGALGNTTIGDGVKIDNQVQVAHNVDIGEQTAIAASTAIAGSTTIGRRCTIAGCVGIVGHLSIADDVHITAMTMVTKSITASGSYSSGLPMNETHQWRKNAVRFNQLDAMARQLKTIKK